MTIDQTLSFKGPFDITEGSGGQFSLDNATRVWTLLWRILKALGLDPATATTASSFPIRISFRSGQGSSLAGLNSNPLFYEGIMGWPTDWTAPEGRVTGFAAWLQRSRGRHLKALSATD